MDFIIGSYKSPLPVEAKYVDDIDWKDRRLSGLRLFLRRFPETKRVVLVTKNFEGETKIAEASIIAVPLWKFLLNSSEYLVGAGTVRGT